MIFEQLTKDDIKGIFSNTVYHRGLRYYRKAVSEIYIMIQYGISGQQR